MFLFDIKGLKGEYPVEKIKNNSKHKWYVIPMDLHDEHHPTRYNHFFDRFGKLGSSDFDKYQYDQQNIMGGA